VREVGHPPSASVADWAVRPVAAAARGGLVSGWVLLGFWRFVIGE